METEVIDFTDEERSVLEYFRPSAAGKWRRGAIFQLSFILVSLALAAVYLLRGDAGAGFVAYALLLWRCWQSFSQTRRYGRVYRSLFTKYDTKLKELAAESTRHPTA
jgi:hypothetical protein